MAHLRLNDRVDVDGKKMTLIEEVQSDWHQAGREKGYKTPELKSALEEYERLVIRNANGQKLTPEEIARAQELRPIVSGKDGGVPDAPMKDTWYQTALRKAVKDAIDSGSDRVGIPTGGMQAERYGQAKKINEIRVYTTKESGRRTVGFQTEGGSTVTVMIDPSGKIVSGQSNMVQEFVGKTLEEMVGKDAATKVLGYGDGNAAFPVQSVSIGGKGMKKYYDDIYPKYLDKFAKKYGSKVSETEIKIGQQIQLGGIGKVQTKTEKVRYIDITPEMRKALGGKDKGVPLFGAGAGALGLLATDEELKKDMRSLLGYSQ